MGASHFELKISPAHAVNIFVCTFLLYFVTNLAGNPISQNIN